MTHNRSVTALIVEDEPLLAAALEAALARTWPELRIVATVGDGISAVSQALQLQPDVLFFDIQMPGLSGLEAAAELADAWPGPGEAGDVGARPFPALVFVTAYDHYAVQAFETQAVDYLLKPVQEARLQKTVAKVQFRQEKRGLNAINSEAQTDHATQMKSRRASLTVAQTFEHSLVGRLQPVVGSIQRLEDSAGLSMPYLRIKRAGALQAPSSKSASPK